MKERITRNILGVAVLLFCSSLLFIFVPELYAREVKKARKILHYRNPMNPSITSEVPAKDHMGMDYIPVYEEGKNTSEPESSAENLVKLSQRDIALSGITSQAVIPRHLFKDIRTVGRIAYDPELYKTEEELIQAIKTKQELSKSDIDMVKAQAESLVEAAKLKLRLSGLSQEQIEELAKVDSPDRSLLISDERNPYVWVYADVYEYELSWVKTGQPVKVTSLSFPGEDFKGVIQAIDPVLNPMTRSVRLRLKIDNPDLKLKPEMYTDIFIEAYLTGKDNQHIMPLAVPRDAVLDTGMRKIVYVDLGDGSYLGREVEVGPQASAYLDGEKTGFYPVVSGLKEGDKVVIQGNFLLDSQSQISGVSAAAYGGALGAKEETKAPIHQH